jgi:nucleotide-binding universal stress UspA family protein
MVTRSPAAAIVEAAPRLGADVIVMATHGRGGLTRLIAGSTASEVLRRTRLPVLLHRPGPHAEPGVAAEALVSRAQ